ncbi:MAG: ParA family protein [Bacillota bacterium]|nr:ParA family protein [Bacillota bacterium]
MGFLISFVNVKGGVGKTTIAFNLSHALRLLRRRVLLIDLDLQENLTDKAIKDRDKVENTVLDLITRDEVTASECIYDTVVDGVGIIPSELEIVRVNKEIDPVSNPQSLFVLKDKLEAVKTQYDYVLLDLHPNVDILTTMALIASSHYIIPIKPDSYSLKGLKIVNEYAGNISRANRNLKEIGILITDLDKRTSLANTFQEALNDTFGHRVMNTVIKRNAAITAAAFNNSTVFQYDQRQPGCQYFFSLAKEVILKCEEVVIDTDYHGVGVNG